jgi:hypothetical protein
MTKVNDLRGKRQQDLTGQKTGPEKGVGRDERSGGTV